MSTYSKFVLSLCLTLPVVSAADADAARSSFIAAMQRVRQHLPDLPDPPALENYAIYSYLVSARLRRDLASGANEELDAVIDKFLDAHTGQPVTRNLRREWLSSLAERARWDWFLPRSSDVSEPSLTCQRLVGRLVTGDTSGLADAALVRWSLPQKQPAACAPIFQWLKKQGLLTPALAESRTRAALNADNPRLAREFAADVPLPLVTPLLRWSDLLEAPRSALNVLATQPALPIESDALAAGFEKLSHTDPGGALALLPALLNRNGMASGLRGRLERAAALGAAYDRDPRAVAAFGAVPAEAVDVAVQEWRVRAALWSGDWAKALDWLRSMPPNLASQPRWRYWSARAVEVLSGSDPAAPLYAEVAGLRDYYGYLAAGHLHLPYKLNAHASPDETAVQAALGEDPGVIRAHALFDCDLTDDAGIEWNAVMTAATPALKVQAAHLASRWGWYAQAIATLAQSGEFDDVALRYPLPYLDLVDDAGKLAQISPTWILGVMRQESLFRKDAVSRADARGLMQMLPSTAASVARRWQLPPPTRDGLFDPTVAVPLGAAYLREMLDHSGGSLVLTLAAYNAGPAAVARWIPHHPMDADIWIENIPYTETRGYVQHILEHIVAFAWIEGVAAPDLDALLLPVQPAPLL